MSGVVRVFVASLFTVISAACLILSMFLPYKYFEGLLYTKKALKTHVLFLSLGIISALIALGAYQSPSPLLMGAFFFTLFIVIVVYYGIGSLAIAIIEKLSRKNH